MNMNIEHKSIFILPIFSHIFYVTLTLLLASMFYLREPLRPDCFHSFVITEEFVPSVVY